MEEDYVEKLKRQHRRNRILAGIVGGIGIAVVGGLLMLRYFLVLFSD